MKSYRVSPVISYFKKGDELVVYNHHTGYEYTFPQDFWVEEVLRHYDEDPSFSFIQGISEEDKEYIFEYCLKEGLIEPKYKIVDRDGSNCISVFQFKQKEINLTFWKNMNKILDFIFCIGLISILFFPNVLDLARIDLSGFDFMVSILFFFVSVFLHEIGHILVGLSENKKVYEIGFALDVLPYFYVVTDTYMDPDVSAAFGFGGLKINFIIAFYSIYFYMFFHCEVFLFLIVINLILIVTNCTFCDEMDGMYVLEKLLGIEELSEKIDIVKKNQRKIIKEMDKMEYWCCKVILLLRYGYALFEILFVVFIIGFSVFG